MCGPGALGGRATTSRMASRWTAAATWWWWGRPAARPAYWCLGELEPNRFSAWCVRLLRGRLRRVRRQADGQWQVSVVANLRRQRGGRSEYGRGRQQRGHRADGVFCVSWRDGCGVWDAPQQRHGQRLRREALRCKSVLSLVAQYGGDQQ